jgi:thiamine pyrophosphokinase
MNTRTVIVADGTFPEHDIPIGYLWNARRIVCCDGSVENLVKAGYIPEAIVGDMDSISEENAERFNDRMFHDDNQDTNDLTKAISWCSQRGYNDIVIVGATGKREDHTIGNISLLAEYAKDVKVIMVTDTGIILPFLESSEILSFAGQQVSIFAINPETEISSYGLLYPLEKKKIRNWWVATLNEALGEKFTLEFNHGMVIVYLKFPDDLL